MRWYLLSALLLFVVSGAASASVTVPTNIVTYVPITLTNSQSAAIAANTPLLITVNATTYKQYETCSLNNTEFFFSNGVVINSWLEGNLTNEATFNSACTSSTSLNALSGSNNIGFWVSYNWPSTFLPASGGTNTIYLGFAGNAISTSNTLFNVMNDGEAPQLSNNYGAYDDGANVFSIYFNGNIPTTDFTAEPGGGTSMTDLTGVSYGTGKHRCTGVCRDFGSVDRMDIQPEVPTK